MENFNPSYIFIVGGVFIFGYWLLTTSLGRKALENSKPRRNSMPIYFPFIIFVMWMIGLVAVILMVESVTEDFEDYQQAIIQNIIQCITSIVISVFVLFLVKRFFARGLKGFGLNFRNVHKEFFSAIATLLAVYPVVIAILTFTIYFLKLIYGLDYQAPVHEELQKIKEYSQVSVFFVIFINGALVTPIFEEILFRGLFQSAIRSYVVKPWTAILMSSAIFSIAHADSAHWPALFMLGLCMGYAYEKSNSLLRPIFIHMLFNGLSILAMIVTSTQG